MASPIGIDGFVHALTQGLPRAGGLWAAGLTAYVVVASTVAVLALRREGGLSFGAVLGQMFPRRLYGDATARITHWHFVIYLVFWAPLFALLSFAPGLAAAGFQDVLADRFGARGAMLHAGWAVLTVQAVVIVLAMSLGSYVFHLAGHKVPLLWSFHRAHHSLEALTLPANAREHPLDMFLTHFTMNLFAGFFGGLVLYLTGTQLHPSVFLIVAAGVVGYFTLFGVFNHTHIPISLGWFNRIVMAPVMHQFHHSAETRHRDRNIGSFWGLMIWDWMFGTIYLPERGEAYRWGLNEAELGAANPHKRLRDFYLEPFRHAWGQVRGFLAGSPRAAV